MTQAFFLIGFGSMLDDHLNSTTFRGWLFQMDAQEAMPNLVLGDDTLMFALASTREEDVTDLSVEKIPEGAVVSLPDITQWVSETRIDQVRQQWTGLREKAIDAGFPFPDGHLLITTGEIAEA